MASARTCNICNAPLHNKRLDAKTCSSSCRSKLFRLNQTKSVWVKFRISSEAYADLAIKAFFAQQSVNAYLTKLVEGAQ